MCGHHSHGPLGMEHDPHSLGRLSPGSALLFAPVVPSLPPEPNHRRESVAKHPSAPPSVGDAHELDRLLGIHPFQIAPAPHDSTRPFPRGRPISLAIQASRDMDREENRDRAHGSRRPSRQQTRDAAAAPPPRDPESRTRRMKERTGSALPIPAGRDAAAMHRRSRRGIRARRGLPATRPRRWRSRRARAGSRAAGAARSPWQMARARPLPSRDLALPSSAPERSSPARRTRGSSPRAGPTDIR